MIALLNVVVRFKGRDSLKVLLQNSLNVFSACKAFLRSYSDISSHEYLILKYVVCDPINEEKYTYEFAHWDKYISFIYKPQRSMTQEFSFEFSNLLLYS